MPSDVTAQLSIEFINPRGMGSSLEIKFVALLDEGFGMTFWSPILPKNGKVWIPASSDKALLAGLFMAATRIAKTPFPFTVEVTKEAVDLNTPNQLDVTAAIAWASGVLEDYVVALTIYPHSSLTNYSTQIQELESTLNFRVFEQTVEPRWVGLG